MRILMCAGFYDFGGSSTVMEKLAGKLSEKGHEVTIGALLFKRLPVKGAYDVTRIPADNVLKLKKFLEKFDVIHNHHPLTNYLSLLNDKPFIYHYHGAPYSKKGILNRLSMFSSITLSGNHFDAIIAISEAAAAELKQLFEPDKIFVIHNGVDTKVFKPGMAPKFRKGRPQFLFVGNLYQHKKVEETILAFKKLIVRYPQAFLQIVGDGSTYNHLKQVVSQAGLKGCVDLVGRVSELELPYYYASCDVYVSSSRWELFGLPLLEAMSCGKPVVASSILAHQDLLRKSNAGTTYTIGDITDLSRKMIQIYQEYNKYSANGISFAKSCDWSFTAERVIKIYELLGEGPAG